MTDREDARPPKIDEKEKISKKRSVKQQLHEYSSGINSKPVAVKLLDIPCSKCGHSPSSPGSRPGIWLCSEHV